MPKKESAQAPSEEVLDLIAASFKVLSEPSRLRLLVALRAKEMSVTELVAVTRTTQSNVSRHLQTLADAGLVRRRKAGAAAYYSIVDGSVFALCEHVCGSVHTRLRHQAKAAAVLSRGLS